MAKVSVRANFDLRRIRYSSPSLMRTVGEYYAERIRQRTRGGRDVDGHNFYAYSPAYAKRKGSSHVDLTLTGEMLDALGVVASTARSVTIGFLTDAAKKKARYNQEGRVPRIFMQVSRSMVRDITAIISRGIDLRMR